jgi:FkbH-like protein
LTELLADRRQEVLSGDHCLKLARSQLAEGNAVAALRSLHDVTRAEDSFLAWQGAVGLLPKVASTAEPRRTARLALLGSYTTDQFGPMLQLACHALGIGTELYAGGYDQYRQEVLDERSGLHRFEPTHVVLAVHEGAAELPELSDDPDSDVEREVARWQSLWTRIGERLGSRIVQHTFAVREDPVLGHLAARLPGSRHAMLQQLNAGLGRSAGGEVALVDCDRLAAAWGKERWFDDRYWFLAKQAVALEALPLLARHTAAVVAGDLGLARKCLVLDLDNTLWGGVVGEDGLGGIRLGGGAEGEAYVAFQERILELKRKGVVLAVASKNDEAEARSVFAEHPEMRIKENDIACFAANWDTKVDNIRWIAETLDLGLDSLVYVDDNPAEREIVRRFLPEVDVLPLPQDPALYRRALSAYLQFETSTLSREDAARSAHYRARAKAAERRLELGDLEDFLRDLEMTATIAPFDEVRLPRVVQLIGKTNQFNLTTRRHSLGRVRELIAEPGAVHLFLELCDRFTDHGLVGVLIAVPRDGAIEIDTWLLSCRVIGRRAEHAMLAQLAVRAWEAGFARIRGTYAPTAKNGVVSDLYASLGFERVGEDGESTVWEYDLESAGIPPNDFIKVETAL